MLLKSEREHSYIFNLLAVSPTFNKNTIIFGEDIFVGFVFLFYNSF